MRGSVAASLIAFVAFACAVAGDQTSSYGFRVLAEYPHDEQAFTQGLVYHRGYLYESTGRYGQSSVRKVDLETGEIVSRRTLPERFFGEGLTVAGERLIQLTWREGTGFVYDPETLELLETFHYPLEGWGLTYDGSWLYMSNGSATLYRLDPETFGVVGKLQVRDGSGPVERLNELEFIDGWLYANVWQETRIAKIDPNSGRVAAWIELAGLKESSAPRAGVLNGIAFDASRRRVLVTGKLWPKLFAIDIVKK